MGFWASGLEFFIALGRNSLAAAIVTAVAAAALAHRFWVRRKAWATVYEAKRESIDRYIGLLSEYKRAIYFVNGSLETKGMSAAKEMTHYLWVLQRRFGPDPAASANRAVREIIDMGFSKTPGIAIADSHLRMTRQSVRNLLLVDLVDRADTVNLEGDRLRLVLRDTTVVDMYEKFVDTGVEAAFKAAREEQEFVHEFMRVWAAELRGLNSELRTDLSQSARGLWWATRRARLRPAWRRLKFVWKRRLRSKAD